MPPRVQLTSAGVVGIESRFGGVGVM